MIALAVTETTKIMTISDDVQQLMNVLKEDNFYEGDMIEFIDEYGNEAFLKYYEEYVRQGEENGYDAVDAFIDEFGINCVEYFEDAYLGSWNSVEEFAEVYCEDMGYNIPSFVVVDWTATWNANLQYDYAYNNGFIFNKNF